MCNQGKTARTKAATAKTFLFEDILTISVFIILSIKTHLNIFAKV